MSVTSEADVLVIGGGIIGLCSAYFLLKERTRVFVVEQNEIWSDSSGANAGTVAVQNKISGLQPLALMSVDLWRQMQSDEHLDLGFRQIGGLRVAIGGDQVRELQQGWSAQAEQELSLRWLEQDELKKFASWLGPDVNAAVYCPADSQSIPLKAGPALRKAVEQQGGFVQSGTTVIDIEPSGDSVLVTTDQPGRIRCCHLVVAAGPWAKGLVRSLGIDLPVSVDVNMLSITEPVGLLMDRVVTHVSGILSLKQYPNGTCMIGGGWQGQGGFDSNTKELDYQNLIHNIRLAASVVPGLRDVNLVRSWAGFEPVMPDALPCLGCLPGHPNIWIATGARGGYSLGPAQGKLISEMVLGKALSLEGTGAFDPGRTF